MYCYKLVRHHILKEAIQKPVTRTGLEFLELFLGSGGWILQGYTIVALSKVNFFASLLGIEPRPCAKRVRTVAGPETTRPQSK